MPLDTYLVSVLLSPFCYFSSSLLLTSFLLSPSFAPFFSFFPPLSLLFSHYFLSLPSPLLSLSLFFFLFFLSLPLFSLFPLLSLSYLGSLREDLKPTLGRAEVRPYIRLSLGPNPKQGGLLQAPGVGALALASGAPGACLEHA